jgi:ubiquinone biosynthesis accessory factor UbiJ
MWVLESPVVAALNHLLQSEAWARGRLAPFAGETCELRAAPLPSLRLRIAAEGLLEPAEDAAAVTLTVTLGPEALPAWLRGEDHFMRAVDVSGNARLASEVLYLLRHLRWDAENDLAAWVGDVLAHRMVGTVRTLAGWQREALARVAGGVVDYAIEEGRLLVGRDELMALGRDVAALRDALDRLELRLARLGR